MSIGRPLAEVLRWGGAGVLVLTAHVAAAHWALQSQILEPQSAAPDAVFIDLEMAPPVAAAPDVPDHDEPVEEVEPAPNFTPPPLEQLEPLEISEPEPAPDFTPPPLEPLEPLDFPELPAVEFAVALAASERPRERPQRKEPEEPRQEPRREEVRERPKAEKPRAQPAPSAPSAARQAAAASRQPQQQAGSGKKALQQWQAQVGARIARHMSRTRLSGRGTARVQVSVTVSPNGATSARLASSTGDARTDRALSAQAGRMPRMPAPPAGAPRSFVLPIAVQMR